MKRYGTELEHPCPECGAPMVLRPSRYGPFYGCTRYPKCTASHGAHRETGEPLGIPATVEVKQARIRAHNEFDKLWKNGHMKRRRAYSWMRRAMELPKEEAHIGRMDGAQCDKLIELVRDKLEELKTSAELTHETHKGDS